MANGQEKLAKNWRNIAKAIFIDNPDWNAGQIHRQLMVVLGEGKAPASVSSIQKLLPGWKRLYSPDRPWSMGALIPQGAAIEPVLSLQRQLLKNGRYLTIRRARWYSALYPVLSPIIKKTYPGDTAQNELRIMQIASFYVRQEQIATLGKNGELLDTSELDRIFLIGQDVSFEAVLREWASLYLPGMVKPDANDITELSQFINLLMQSVEQSITFIKEHPEVQPLAEKWMVLSTRQDIISLRKNNKEGENERSHSKKG